MIGNPPDAPSAPPTGAGEKHVQRLAAVVELTYRRGDQGITVNELRRIYWVSRSAAEGWVRQLVRWGYLLPKGRRYGYLTADGEFRLLSSRGRPSTIYVLNRKPKEPS